jgi:hypothetical protein
LWGLQACATASGWDMLFEQNLLAEKHRTLWLRIIYIKRLSIIYFNIEVE